MDFSHSRRVVELQGRLTRFMDEHVYPAEAAFAAEVESNRRAGNAWVPTRIMETLNDLLVGSRKLTLQQKGRPVRSIRGHEAVVSALRKHDGDAAASAMRDHIEQIAELLQQASEMPASSAGQRPA